MAEDLEPGTESAPAQAEAQPAAEPQPEKTASPKLVELPAEKPAPKKSKRGLLLGLFALCVLALVAVLGVQFMSSETPPPAAAPPVETTITRQGFDSNNRPISIVVDKESGRTLEIIHQVGSCEEHDKGGDGTIDFIVRKEMRDGALYREHFDENNDGRYEYYLEHGNKVAYAAPALFLADGKIKLVGLPPDTLPTGGMATFTVSLDMPAGKTYRMWMAAASDPSVRLINNRGSEYQPNEPKAELWVILSDATRPTAGTVAKWNLMVETVDIVTTTESYPISHPVTWQ